MSSYTQAELEDKFRQGIELARKGESQAAYNLFQEIAKIQPTNEQALIWKAAVTRDPQEAVTCLELVLKLNPDNQRARSGLVWARKRAEENNGGAEVKVKLPEAVKPLAPKPTTPRIANTPVVAKTAQNETKVDPAPYKRSRFQTGTKIAATVAANQPKEKSRGPATKNNKTRKTANVQRMESAVMRAALPKVALKVSDKVARGANLASQAYFSRSKVALRWPLLLFGLAFLLALASFVAVALAPLLGIGAILLALTGVYLFTRADF